MHLAELVSDQNPWWREPGLRPTVWTQRRRFLHERILDQLLSADRRAAVIMGPRQVGKTVLLTQLVQDLLEREIRPQNITYFDFSDDRLTQSVSPRDVVEVEPVGLADDEPRFLLLDEISRARNWALWIKQAVDRGVGKIVATDSAASLLKGGSRESGQGRWDEYRMEGLTFGEFVHLQGASTEGVEETLKRSPNLFERYLALGGFPEHVWSEDFGQVRLRLREDIVDRAILRDLARFRLDLERVKDLFVYLVQDSGAIFDATARARDLDKPTPPDPRSVRGWLERLEETLLVHRLDSFHRRPSAQLRARSKPRIYAADHGIVRAFAVSPTNDPRSDGRVLEAAVFRHLRELSRQHDYRLSYFRVKDDLEVDFIVERDRGAIALEVTSGRRLRPEKLGRLSRTAEKLRPRVDRVVLVHAAGVQAARDDDRGIDLASVEQFLLQPERWLE